MTTSTAEVIDRYNEAFRVHDPSMLDGLIAPECVIEDTGPAPDGARLEGGDACLKRWSDLSGDPSLQFTPENVEIHEDLAVIQWVLRWGSDAADHVRGVNLMRVRGGQIVEARGYTKA
jgi:hypothetical protein